MMVALQRQVATVALLLLLQFSNVSPFSTNRGIITATSQAASLLRNKKNAVDEILDALDTMMGVSPLAETDLKCQSPDWEQAQRRREEQSPPEDALQKPSVAIFFALLGIIPTLLTFYAVQHGVRPFGL